MKPNIINNDISRCNNHRCRLRMNCKRYLQLGIDFENYKDENYSFRTTPVSRFEANKSGKCDNYLETTK